MSTQTIGLLAQRGLRYGGLLLVFVFTIASLAALKLGAGWWWDIAGGVGFVALVFFALLNLAPGQGARLGSHKILGWWALGLTIVHAGLYLITDTVVVNHLKLMAPPAMLVGIAALVVGLVGGILSLSRWKLKVHGSRDNFRRYHRAMSWVVLLGSLYHIAISGHSIYSITQMVALGVGAFVLLLVAPKVAPKLEPQLPMVGLLLMSLLAVGLFVVLRNV